MGAVDIRMNSKNTILVEKWFGIKKELAAVRTVCSHIENMFKGVIKGYKYKMRSVLLISPSTLPSLRETPLLRCVTSWERNSLVRFACWMVSPARPPKPRRTSSFLKETISSWFHDQLPSFSSPPL